MALSLFFRQLLLTFLIFILAAPAQMIRVAHAAEAHREQASEVSLALVNEEIDRQASILLEQIKQANPEIPSSIVEKLHRQAMFRFRQLTSVGEILKASGKAPATALLVGTILSNFVAAPLLAYLGRPAEAAVVMTVPWGIISGAGAAAFQVQNARFKIARSLKLVSLSELDRMREAVIGYNTKHRVSSAVYQSIEEAGAVDFEILTKARSERAPKASFVTLSELEEIIGSTQDGQRFIEQIFNEQSNRALYAALMLKYASSNEMMTERLASLLKLRTPTEEAADKSLRNHLIALDETRKQVSRDVQALQAQVKEVKSAFKSGLITKAEAEEIRKRFKTELERLLLVKSQIPKHEYALLLAAKSAASSGNASSITRVVQGFASSLKQIQDSSRLLIGAQIPTSPMAQKHDYDLKGVLCSAAFAP